MAENVQPMLGAGDDREWEPTPVEPAVEGHFPGPWPKVVVCDFCAHLDGVENTEVAGFYLVRPAFCVYGFYPADADSPLPIAPLVNGLFYIDPSDPVPMDHPVRRRWSSPFRWFACPRHVPLIEADPRYTRRPEQPHYRTRAATGVVDAFFACRTSDLTPILQERPQLVNQ